MFANCLAHCLRSALAITEPCFRPLVNVDRKLVFGTIAAGGTLGNLIPPSIPLIIYAALVDESVGRLFMGALIPGLMMTGIFFIYVFFRSRNLPAIPHQEKSEQGVLRDVFAIILDILPFALIFVCDFRGGAPLSRVGNPNRGSWLGRDDRRHRRRDYPSASMVQYQRRCCCYGDNDLCYTIGSNWGRRYFHLHYTRSAFQVPSATWVGTLSINPLSVLVVIIVMYMILGMFIDPISMMVFDVGGGFFSHYHTAGL